MIANQIIKSCLDDMKAISKVELACYDIDGTLAAATAEDMEISP